MSIDDLQQKDLLPHTFKYIGFGIALLCFVYSLIFHLVEAGLLFSGLHIPKLLFGAGLIIAIASKEPFEDERVRQIRSHVHYILSGLFIGFIFWRELGGDVGPMFSALCAFLMIYALIFHFIYYAGINWILNNRGKFWSVTVVILVFLLILFEELWVA